MKKGLILSSLSGFLLIFAFAPFSMGYIAWVAFIPLFFALESNAKTLKKAFFLGWAWGFIFFTGAAYWVIHSMYFYGGISFPAAFLIMLLLVFYLSLFGGLFSLFFTLAGKAGWMRFVSLPFFWVFLEYLRGWLLSGFPWVLLGYSQVGYLKIIQIADIFGVWGVSFFVMAVNTLLYLVIKSLRERKDRVALTSAASAVFLFFAVFGYGFFRTKEMDRAVSLWRPIKVFIAQGNIEQSLKWDEKMKLETVDIYRNMSENPASDLIVFPETAMPFYLAYEKELASVVKGIPERSGSYLLTGAPHYDYNMKKHAYNLYNSAFVFNPQGDITGRYDKVHLVPFGEYVPLKKLLFFAEKLTEGAGEFLPGEGLFPVRLDGYSAGVLICYEAIFPEISAGFLNNGANLLVNITNDAWFGKTSAPYQHFDMSVFRAVENRVYLVRAANTGISAFIDPAGRILDKTSLFKREVLKGEVRIKNGQNSFFSGHPRIFPCGASVFSAIMILLAIYRRRKAGV